MDGNPPKEHAIEASTQITKTIFVDDRFNENERDIIMEAADDWNEASAGLVNIHLNMITMSISRKFPTR